MEIKEKDTKKKGVQKKERKKKKKMIYILYKKMHAKY
jgi:hypothetical protein